MEGTFGDGTWWGVGAGGPDRGGVVGQEGNDRYPDGTGSWGQECQMAGEGGDDSW